VFVRQYFQGFPKRTYNSFLYIKAQRMRQCCCPQKSRTKSGWQEAPAGNFWMKRDGAQSNADGSPRNPWNVYASISGATKTAVLAKLTEPGGFYAELTAALS